MNALPAVYFSNRVEILYENLREVLFDSTQSSFFTRRLIIVPSPAMKSWLMLRMAQDLKLGVATGLRIAYLNEALDIINNEIGEPQSYKTIPNALELSFAIESIIRESHGHSWSQVERYLSSGTPIKNNKRCASLVDQLAQLFTRYGNYGGQCLQEWEDNPSPSWQIQLWKKLYKQFPEWSFPYQKLTNFKCVKGHEDYQVHVFAMSFLSHLHYNFMSSLATQIPVHLWIMSPCQAFWSDLCSDKEKQRLRSYWQKKNVSENQLQALEQYLRDRNPLLANFGKLGKEMALQIEESNAIVNSLFELPESVLGYKEYEELYYDEILLRKTQEPLKLLEAIQADLALLRTPEQHPLILQAGDNSIQIHSASSKLREVQVLYDNLLALIDKDQISSGQIIVMAPDIIDYEPYIRYVFGAPDSQVDWQMIDLPMQNQNSLVQVFLQIINLPATRWEASALFALFEQSAFYLRHRLKKDEVESVREWIQKFKIYWGQDLEHRQEIFSREYGFEKQFEASTGTWEQGWKRALQTLAIEDFEGLTIEYSRCELLGKWMTLCRSLKKDLHQLESNASMTLEEWADYFHNLVVNYLSPHENQENFEALLELFQTFKKASKDLKNEKFSFISIKHRLFKEMERKDFSYRESHLQAVRFCSMLPMRAVPAQIVALLGMNEGAYPRRDLPFSLDLLSTNQKGDYCPTNTDYDRYLFLEALLSARKYFLLSYCDYAPLDPKPLPPAIIVSELINYLDQSFVLGTDQPSKVVLKRHPFHPFDARYFTKESGFTSFSQKAYKQALAFYKVDKEPSHCFIEHFPNLHAPNDHEIQIVELYELANVLSHPLKHYFNKGLGIYLEKRSNRELPTDESFELKSWELNALVKQSLNKPVDEVIVLADRKGILPSYPFKDLACTKIRKELDSLQKQVQDDVFSIEFCLQCKEKIQIDHQKWIFPPLKISLNDSHVHLIGKIPYLSKKGIIYDSGKREFTHYVKFLPYYLAYCATGFGNSVIFPDLKRQKKPFELDPELQLHRLLEYFVFCKYRASPLVKAWTRPIVQGNVDHLSKVMKNSYGNDFSEGDDYLNWAYRANRFPSPEAIINEWQSKGAFLFGPIEEYWY